MAEPRAIQARPLQFRSGDSRFHRLGAGWKLLVAAAVGAIGLALDGLPALVGLSLLVASAYFAVGLAWEDLWKDVRWLLAQAGVVVALTLALRGSEAFGAGCRTGLQLLLLFLPVALVLRTTPTEALLEPLRCWLPERLAFALGATLRFLPVFARELGELVEMQRLRGARLHARDLWRPSAWRDLLECIAFPMTVRAIEIAEEAAEAAEIRGVGGPGPVDQNEVAGRTTGRTGDKGRTMKTRWLVAIDDTDNFESIGTGRLARMLAAHLVEEGQIANPTITRHQLLVHPDVPYTSHNSSACIGAVGDDGAGDELFDLAKSFLLAHEHEGANPGLCVSPEDAVPTPLPELGRRAQQIVLDLERFDAEIAPFGLRVWSNGETGQGRIGAVCGVALRSTGQDGRFIDLPGIRSMKGRARVAEVLERTGVDRVVTEEGQILEPDVEIETRDWIRPDLRDGLAVFEVRREGGDWVPAQRRSKDDG